MTEQKEKNKILRTITIFSALVGIASFIAGIFILRADRIPIGGYNSSLCLIAPLIIPYFITTLITIFSAWINWEYGEIKKMNFKIGFQWIITIGYLIIYFLVCMTIAAFSY